MKSDIKIILDEEEKPLYKGDQLGLFDQKFAHCTFIKYEQLHLLEVAILVIAQFGQRVSAWLTKKAAEWRQIEKLFRITNNEQKNFGSILNSDEGDGDGDSSEAKLGENVLDFLDLDKISEVRGGQETRDEIYTQAQKRFHEIVLECKKYGVLSEELRDRAYNTDYVALKKLNERYELAFDKVDDKINRHTELIKVYDCFYQKHKSKTEEVRERI